jgi:nitrite reductase/ring-hydroxylating ferredoxin subunit
VAQTGIEVVANQRWIDEVATPLRDAVRALWKDSGPAGQTVKNALHGVWLGHPLHPVLTDVPVGAWTTALALDAKAATTGDVGYRNAADFALAVGLVGAAGAAVTGLNDWSETDGPARRLGVLHGLLNIAATSFVATGYVLRRNHARHAGSAWTIAGVGLAMASAYLGGALVYRERIGVSHAAAPEPETFTPVIASADVPDNTMHKAAVDDGSVLVVRQRERVCALAHPCVHLGGPLSEGELKNGSVVCPWHGSEFSLDDGHVINGPSVHPQPRFEARERNGQIEVRAPGTPRQPDAS